MTMLTRRSLLLGLCASAAIPVVLRAEPQAPPPPIRPQGVADAPSTALPTEDELITHAALGGVVAFAAIDTRSGQVIASRGADLSLPPASTLKSITAAYALDRLGAGFRFRTRVLRSGDALVLVGGGDPELDTDGLAELARMVARAERESGRQPPTRLLVWGGALPHVPQIAPQQAVHLPYNPTISGMILNFNRVHLGWSRGKGGYRMSLEARGSRQSPRAYTVSIGDADRGAPLFTYDGTGGTERWTIARRAMGQAGSRWLPVRRPELYAGDVFQTLCRAEGLPLPTPEVAAQLPAGQEIAARDSRPLRDILIGMMEYSNNLTAEVVGLVASGASDLSQSARAMGEWFAAHLPGRDFDFADHSGLSPNSRVTARGMAEFAALPELRRELRGLMRHIQLRNPDGKRIDSQIRIDAKTGTLNFVSNLVGYAQNGAVGGKVAFAVLTVDEPRRAQTEGQELPQGVSGWTRRSKALQQALVETWVTGDETGITAAGPPINSPDTPPVQASMGFP